MSLTIALIFTTTWQEASAASEIVLLVHTPGAATHELEEELRLVGLEVESEGGTKKEARKALETRGIFAVVFLEEDGASIWVGSGEAVSRETKPVHVERSKDESSEMFALRSAELLRGSLLPGQHDSGESQARRGEHVSANPIGRAVSLTLGPALLLQSYAVVAPGFTGDLAAWFGRYGVGPYFALPVLRNSWTGTKHELTFTQYSLGLSGRFLPFRTPDRTFELQALVRTGITRLALERDNGPQAQRFTATVNLLSVGAGIEASFGITDWLRLGSQTFGGLDIPLNRPIQEDIALPKPAKGKAAPSSFTSTQRHLTVSAIAIAHF